MDILKAVNELYGDCLQDGSQIYVGTSPITTEQLAEATAKAEADYEVYSAKEYARLRKAEYDKLNQDEMRFDDLVNGTTTWQDAIVAIKNKYPKGVINGSRDAETRN